MTDSTPESKPEVVSQEPPTPKFTEPSAVSSTSTVDMDALAEKVAAKLMPTFEKMSQSQKDKRIAKIEKQLEAAGLAELEEMGATIPENVKLEYRLRQLETRESAPVPEKPKATGNSDAAAVSAVIKETGLDANSPEVITLLKGEYRNLDHFAAEAFRLRTRLANQPAPDASAAPAQAGSAPKGENPEVRQRELTGKLNEWYKNPSDHQAEIKAAEKELGW